MTTLAQLREHWLTQHATTPVITTTVPATVTQPQPVDVPEPVTLTTVIERFDALDVHEARLLASGLGVKTWRRKKGSRTRKAIRKDVNRLKLHGLDDLLNEWFANDYVNVRTEYVGRSGPANGGDVYMRAWLARTDVNARAIASKSETRQERSQRRKALRNRVRQGYTVGEKRHTHTGRSRKRMQLDASTITPAEFHHKWAGSTCGCRFAIVSGTGHWCRVAQRGLQVVADDHIEWSHDNAITGERCPKAKRTRNPMKRLTNARKGRYHTDYDTLHGNGGS